MSVALSGWSVLSKEDLIKRVAVAETKDSLTLEETQLLDAARERLRTWRAPTRTTSSTKRKTAMVQENKTTDEAIAKVVAAANDAEKTEQAAKKKKPKPAPATEADESSEIEAGAEDNISDLIGEVDEANASESSDEIDETAMEAPAKIASKPKKTKLTKSNAKPKSTVESKETKTMATKTKKAAPKAAKATKAKASKAAKAAKANGSNGTFKRIPDDAVLRLVKGFKNPFKEGSGPYQRFEICAKNAGKTYGALRAMSSLKPTTPLNFVKAGGGQFIDKGK